MKLSLETRKGAAILKISGRMIFDPTLYAIRDIVQQEIAKGVRKFIVDLSDAPFVDSSGFGELISIYTSIARVQGSMVLVKPVERVRLLLERIRLTEIFTIAETIPEL